MASWFRAFTQTFSGVPSENFNTWLSDHYDLSPPSVPDFFEGDFFTALSVAQAEGRSLLVWLHSAKGPLTDALVRQVLTAEELLCDVGAGRLSCWAGDVCRLEPSRVAAALHVRDFPAVALLRPMASGVTSPPRFGVHFALEGEGVAPRALLARLRQVFAQELAARQLRVMTDRMLGSVAVQAAEARQQAEQREVLRHQEAEESPLFCTLYESQYDAGHPPFMEMGFDEAIGQAKREGKLLLAWLRSAGADAADSAFGKCVWPSEVVQAFVHDHFLVWVGDVDRWLGPSQLRQVLQLPVVPALVALLPVSVYDADGLGLLLGRALEGVPCEHPAGTAWQVLGWLDASRIHLSEDGGEEPVAQFLCEMAESQETRARAAEEERSARAQEALQWRALREQQDAEFEESLRVDQAAAPSEPTAQQSAPVDDTAVAPPVVPDPPYVLRRREIAQRLAAEGSFRGSAEECCRLVVRLPNGRRGERAFNACDTVASVYAWADCLGELESCDGGVGRDGIEVPEHFLLCVTYPRQPLTDRTVDLRSAGLCPNAVLALAPTSAP